VTTLGADGEQAGVMPLGVYVEQAGAMPLGEEPAGTVTPSAEQAGVMQLDVMTPSVEQAGVMQASAEQSSTMILDAS
jgi:hypothetical protein